ncbi:hypothetical protein EON66_09710 [archaeon]|nr:MAG: hypothetical protein EON66_09710 [archaeon]
MYVARAALLPHFHAARGVCIRLQAPRCSPAMCALRASGVWVFVCARADEVVAETGKGTFGKVLLCTDTSTGTSVAIKVVRSIEKYTVAAETEASILEDVMEADRRGTSFIVRYHQSFKFKGHFCIVFELLGPSLFDYVKANGYRPMPLACVQAFADQLLTAVGFMHRMNLIHTDLKLENVLLVSREPFHKCNEPTSSRKHETVLAPASAAIKCTCCCCERSACAHAHAHGARTPLQRDNATAASASCSD